jgi:hypothetical protein
MVAIDLIKNPAVLEQWPLRRILKYARLHRWSNTTPEEREAEKKEVKTREWKKRVLANQAAGTDKGRTISIEQLSANPIGN